MISVREQVPLSPLTTFAIGGNARYVIEASDLEGVREALAFARERSLPVFVLGGGSNILVADAGFPGVVLSVRAMGKRAQVAGDRAIVSVGAGESWDAVVAWTIEHGYTGLECLSGIPGTVGGAVVANVGAYGVELSNYVVAVEVLDTHAADQVPYTIAPEDCAFSYHDSRFSHEHGRFVILSLTLSLSTGPAIIPRYADSRFDTSTLAQGEVLTGARIREVILSIRDAKGTLIKTDGTSFKCAGSFFHMPYLSAAEAAHVAEVARARDAALEETLRPWRWTQADGRIKVAPGFLLEYTPYRKGYRRGAVGISPKHTLTIINADGATAAEVAELARDMQGAVEELFGVSLEREVEYVGAVE